MKKTNEVNDPLDVLTNCAGDESIKPDPAVVLEACAAVAELVEALRPMYARTFYEARENEDQRMLAQRDRTYPPPEKLWCRADALNPCWSPGRPYTGKHWGWTPDMGGDGAVCEECRVRAALAKFGGVA